MAMIVANTLISILVFGPYNLNLISAALISSGIGTIIYLIVTKLRSPVFLGSSAALMPVITTALAMGGTEHGNFIALIIGVTTVGVVDVIIAIVAKFVGVKWLDKLLPPVVVGPVIMLIGLGLASFATDWTMHNGGTEYSLVSIFVAIVTMITICCVSHYSKKTMKTLPFLAGLLVGYVLSLALTGIGYATNNNELKLIDFSVFNEIEWLPTFAFMKAADGVEANGFEWSQIPNILLVAIPITFVSLCEHIGDHLNLSNMTGRNLLEDPGLKRTIMGDGIATAVCGSIGGLDTTTYGENIAVIGVTKIACSRILLVTAAISIVMGFFGPLMTFIESIPYAVFGGAALILYGFIAMSGIRSLQTVDLQDNKNSLVVSVILIAGVGGLTLNFVFGDVPFTFTSTALAMILGIILNLILSIGRKKKSTPTANNLTSGEKDDIIIIPPAEGMKNDLSPSEDDVNNIANLEYQITVSYEDLKDIPIYITDEAFAEHLISDDTKAS